MKLRYYLLQYQEEASFVLAAVHVDVVEVDVALLGFAGYASSKMLRQHGFSGSNFARYDYTLCHFSWRFNCVAEILVEKFKLVVAVLKF
jgi:hypothetical protein